MTRITKHLVNLQIRIRDAAHTAGRNESDVSILAVSKRQSVDAIHKAQAAGLNAMGENYLREALEKMPLCPPETEWHFIGRLQSNKTRAVAEHFDWVQTLDSAKMVRRLNAQRTADRAPLNACIQIRVDDHGAHGGVRPEEAAELCRLIEASPRLKLRGLMAIPEPAETQAGQRPAFRRLRELYDQLRSEGFELDTLSMGMTGDLEAAILEGSTMVRIGTALFGPRPE